VGYTHHFAYDYTHPSFRGAWPQMVSDANRIVMVCQQRGVGVAGWDGVGRPQIDSTGIALNGVGDESHESLNIELAESAWSPDDRFIYSFCKTNRKPYDIVVTAILLRCHELAPESFAIASDGSWEYEWRFGSADASYRPSHRLDPAPTRWPGQSQRIPVASPRFLVRELFPGPAELGRPSPFSNVIEGPPCIERKSA
jgi:hypothetical protein